MIDSLSGPLIVGSASEGAFTASCPAMRAWIGDSPFGSAEWAARILATASLRTSMDRPSMTISLPASPSPYR